MAVLKLTIMLLLVSRWSKKYFRKTRVLILKACYINSYFKCLTFGGSQKTVVNLFFAPISTLQSVSSATSLEAKLTSPNIQKPKQENGSTSVQVLKELFSHKKPDHMCKNSNGHSSENRISYPNPTRMRNFKSIEYEIVVRTVRETKQLYEDPQFPADDSSIGNIPDLKGKVEWKRPKEINRDAQFFSGSPSRFDVDQGYLGKIPALLQEG
ncbi:unnamed protein product [Trichobilharzia regenti]|nr:unnamed protein product [Trichobilharzia regenti]